MSFAIPQGSTAYLYMNASGFNTPGGVPVNIPDSSGWTYTFDSPQPLGSSMRAAGLIVERNDITVGSTPKDTLDFSTTFNVSASPNNEANISINHDSLKARPGSKLTYLHDLFVDRALSAHDETSLANAHTKALDSNFVLLIPPDYSAAAMTFTNRDSALRLINYATINITASDTIPAGANIVMAGKGRFNISSGVTLTFASGSRFDGGLQRRFIGSGTVKFQEDVVSEIYPQWWGAVGDSSTQCVAAFQSAVNSRVKRITVKVPDGVYLFNDNLTIPSNVSLTGKGRFNILSGKTLTFASGSRFDGGRQRRFTGAGSVKFQEGSVDAVYPEWWGAVADSSTESVTAIEAAIASGVKRNRISFAPGVYKINDHIDLVSNIDLIGNNTCIVSSDTNDYVFKGGPLLKNIKISGFTLRYQPRNTVRQPNTSAIIMHEVDSLEITHNRILFAPGMGMQLASVKNAKISFNHVENTLGDGIHITNGLNSNTGRTMYSENVIITDNTVRNAGDDKIAVSGYKRQAGFLASLYGTWTASQEINRRIVIANNIVEGGNSNYNARGISVIGARDVVVDGNTVRGFTGGKMTSGINVDRISNLDGFRNQNVVVSNNVIVDGQYTSFVDNFGGIKLGSVDSVIVVGNYISWTPYTFGIRIRSDTVGTTPAHGFTNGCRGAIIANNIIQNARVGISLLATNSTTMWNKEITIQNNYISNSQRGAIVADSVEGISVIGNRIENVNTSGTASQRAIDLNRVDKDVIIKDNILRSTTSVEYAISVSRPKSTADIREIGNVFNIATTTAKNNINFAGKIAAKYFSQDSIRMHFRAGAPDSGTWAKGDITFNRNPDDGENFAWICTVAGTPGTWTPVGAKINGIGVSDTTGYVLTAVGAATITGKSNVILDTFGTATLDTVTTLTGAVGQIIYISTRVGSRDIRFLDSGNFRLAAERLLDTIYDVLVLKAMTTTQWKEVSFSDNQ